MIVSIDIDIRCGSHHSHVYSTAKNYTHLINPCFRKKTMY